MAGEIFISYRRADVACARLLHSQLRAEGVEAWYDALVGAGQDWRLATAKALEASQIFVLLFSENAAQSSDIAKELAAAVMEKKLIVPIRLQNIAPKGAFLYELASRNWIDAYDGTETKLAEVAKGLAHLVRTGVRDESVLPFEHTSGSSRPGYIRKLLWPAAAAVVIALSAAVAWLFWPEPKWEVESSRPFLSTLELESEPRFSPDGTQLAYLSGTAQAHKIYVRNLTGGGGIKISTDVYDDTNPTWSSDGNHLAYVASKNGEPCHIMVATVPAGGVREVGRCRNADGSAIAWQPGTSFIYFTDSHVGGNRFGGIYRLNLDTGARGPIFTPENTNFFDLAFSRDGRSLLYRKASSNPGTQLVIVRDLASGREKILTRMLATTNGVWYGTAAWSEDSGTVLVSLPKGGGTEIIAFPLNGSKSYKVYSSATPISQMAAGLGGHLAVVTDVSRKNLARASPKPLQQPDQLDGAGGITSSPDFSQDGTMIFLSNRNGANAVWIKRPGQPPAVLFDLGADAPGVAAIAPDGRHIAVASNVLDRGTIIRVLTAEGATSCYFHVDSISPGSPTWTPDSRALVLYDPARQQAMRVDIDNPVHRTPAAPPLWYSVAVRDDGTYARRGGKPGVWRIEGEKLISAKYPRFYYPPLAFRGGELLIPDFYADGGARILAQPLAGGPERILAYAPGTEDRFYHSRIAVNPTNGEIIYVATIVDDTNIDLLTLVRH